MPPKKRKAGDDKDSGSSSSSNPPPAVKVKIEQIESVGDTNDRPIDLIDVGDPIDLIDAAPTSDQLTASEKKGRVEGEMKGRVEGEKKGRAEGQAEGEKKARVDIAINNANNNFMCPIGLTIMYRPVIAADGNNYEESTLITRLKDSDLSPLDNSTKLTVKGLIQNRQLKNMIEEFVTSDDCPADMKKDWEESKKESDMVAAKKLFDEGKILESANLGYAKAEGIMANNYVLGKEGFAVDYVKCFDFATKAANSGDKLGKFILGRCYCNGWGVAINYATALTWYERCEDEHPAASTNMGWIYENGGYGVVVNLTKAVEYYREAADQGNYTAQYNLACMEDDDEGRGWC